MVITARGALASRRLARRRPAACPPGTKHWLSTHTSHTLSGKAGTLLHRDPFSPAVFGGGEGADRRMRGRCTRTSFAHVGRSHISRIRPPHPPSAPSPPAKNRGGRRTLDERACQRVQA